MGCASGKGAGPRNIFGSKYRQNLAAVQIAREKRMEAKQKVEEEKRQRKEEEDRQKEDDDEETDDSDDNFGPSPSAGIWAGSQKLKQETERIADPDAGEEETDDKEEEERPSKKVRTDD